MLKLSDLVIPWLKEKGFPVTIKESSSPGTWWIDADISSNLAIAVPGALGAIIDNAAVPYVIMLNTRTMKYEYYNAVDPEFFEKIEKGITARLEEHGIPETADIGRPS